VCTLPIECWLAPNRGEGGVQDRLGDLVGVGTTMITNAVSRSPLYTLTGVSPAGTAATGDHAGGPWHSASSHNGPMDKAGALEVYSQPLRRCLKNMG
jgi:hypothetical protein